MQLRATPRRAPRAALHLLGVTVLACAAVLLTSAPGQAAAPARPDSYGGDAVASGLHLAADRNPQPTPVTDLVHAELPYAVTSLDSSGGASASATPLYPGAGLLGVPALLCQFSAQACLPLPDYPLLASASYPTTPDAQAPSSHGTIENGPLAVAPALTTAHADPNRVEATTTGAGLVVDGVASAQAVTSHSKQAFEGSTLVVTAESTVKDLDVAGQLHVDAVRSVAVAHVDGQKVTTSSALTTVTGATLGGVPVSIDSTGVHLAGQGDGGVARTAVDTALAALDAAGITVRLPAPTRSAASGAAAAATGGLLVTFTRSVDLPTVPIPAQLPPLPVSVGTNGDYFGSLTVAGAGVTAFASAPLLPGPWIDVPLPTVQLPQVTGGQPGAGRPVLAGTRSASAVTSGRDLPQTLPPTQTRPAAVLGVDLSNERLRALALVLLGYPVLVLLTGPMRSRPRTPKRT